MIRYPNDVKISVIYFTALPACIQNMVLFYMDIRNNMYQGFLKRLSSFKLNPFQVKKGYGTVEYLLNIIMWRVRNSK